MPCFARKHPPYLAIEEVLLSASRLLRNGEQASQAVAPPPDIDAALVEQHPLQHGRQLRQFLEELGCCGPQLFGLELLCAGLGHLAPNRLL